MKRTFLTKDNIRVEVVGLEDVAVPKDWTETTEEKPAEGEAHHKPADAPQSVRKRRLSLF